MLTQKESSTYVNVHWAYSVKGLITVCVTYTCSFYMYYSTTLNYWWVFHVAKFKLTTISFVLKKLENYICDVVQKASS